MTPLSGSLSKVGAGVRSSYSAGSFALAVAAMAMSCFFLPRVQTVAHFLAGLEERHSPPGDRYGCAASWVAADAGGPVPYREYAEAAQLYPATARKCRNNLTQYGVDDPFDIARIKMRAGCRDVLNKFGLDHGGRPRRGCQVEFVHLSRSIRFYLAQGNRSRSVASAHFPIKCREDSSARHYGFFGRRHVSPIPPEFGMSCRSSIAARWSGTGGSPMKRHTRLPRSGIPPPYRQPRWLRARLRAEQQGT